MDAKERRGYLLLGLAVALSLVYRVLFLARSSSRWMENDTMVMGRSLRFTLRDQLVAPTAHAYPFGYAYQSLGAMFIHYTGIDPLFLQSDVMPFLGILLIPAVFVFARAATGNAEAAGFAALLVGFQSDVLFTTLRGSHEKITFLLFVVILWMLIETTRKGGSIGYVVASIFVLWAATSTTSFWSTVMLLGLLAMFAVGRFARDHGVPQVGGALPRGNFLLLWAAAVAAFVAMLYAPSIGYIKTVQGFYTDLESTLYGVATAEPGTVYSTIATHWTSVTSWVTLILPNVLILVAIAAAWIVYSRRVLRKENEFSPSLTLSWLAVPVFGTVLVAGFGADSIGYTGINNTQLRALPFLVLAASPLLGAMLVHWKETLPRRAVLSVAVAFMLLAVPATYLKGTNHPALSNLWMEYEPTESDAIDWLASHEVTGSLWIDYTTRLPLVYVARHDDGTVKPFKFYYGTTAFPPDYVFLSDPIHEMSFRYSTPVPDIAEYNHIYSAGDVELYSRTTSL